MSSALSLAESLLKAGNAAAAYKVLSDFPEPGAKHHYLLGLCAARTGNKAVAISALVTALAADPLHVEAARLLGELYLQVGLADKAERLYRDVLSRREDEGLRMGLGRLLAAQGRVEDSLAAFADVLRHNPRHALARQFRAEIFMKLERPLEALEEHRALAGHYPESAAPWANLGILEGWLGRYEESVAHLEQAVRLQPDNGTCWFELAVALTMSGRVEAAGAAFARLREVDPARWQDMLATTQVDRGWGVADEIDPRPFFLLFTYRQLDECNWTYRDAYQRVFAEFVKAPKGNPLGFVHCSGIAGLAVREQLGLLEHAGAATAPVVTPWAHAPAPMPARLRIGYVLPHLGPHVVATIIERLLAAHSAAVEVVVVSTSMMAKDYDSALLARVRAQPGVQWVDVTGLDDDSAAARVRDLGLDVLVDLGVYNDHARPAILARKPAPLQVNWLGAPYSSGASWMDYILTDPVVSPGLDGWCTEAEVVLPSCYFAFGHQLATPPALPPRATLGLPADRFIYSALHNGYKIDPEAFAAWMRILQATPGSVLLLRDGKELRPNLLRHAAAHGVGAERLVFAARLPDELYLARQGAVDLFLDARLYNAHTTMAETLWMGAPALSCPGEAFQNRVGASLLTSCGLQDLVMPDWASYEATAIALFHDRPRLQGLRERLAVNRAQAAPFDMAAQARALEKAFHHMRQRFADGLPPKAFRVADLPDAAPAIPLLPVTP